MAHTADTAPVGARREQAPTCSDFSASGCLPFTNATLARASHMALLRFRERRKGESSSISWLERSSKVTFQKGMQTRWGSVIMAIFSKTLPHFLMANFQSYKLEPFYFQWTSLSCGFVFIFLLGFCCFISTYIFIVLMNPWHFSYSNVFRVFQLSFLLLLPNRPTLSQRSFLHVGSWVFLTCFFYFWMVSFLSGHHKTSLAYRVFFLPRIWTWPFLQETLILDVS